MDEELLLDKDEIEQIAEKAALGRKCRGEVRSPNSVQETPNNSPAMPTKQLLDLSGIGVVPDTSPPKSCRGRHSATRVKTEFVGSGICRQFYRIWQEESNQI